MASWSEALGCLFLSSCKNTSLTVLKSREPGTSSRDDLKLLNSSGKALMSVIMAISSWKALRVMSALQEPLTFCNASSKRAVREVRDSSGCLEMDRNSSSSKKRAAALSSAYCWDSFSYIPLAESRKSRMRGWIFGSTWE